MNASVKRSKRRAGWGECSCAMWFSTELKNHMLTKVVVYEWLLDPVNAQCLPHGLTEFTDDHTTQAILTLCPLQGGDPCG
jgi:hypothetical protein